MSAVAFTISLTADEVTPFLRKVLEQANDRVGLNTAIAARSEELTRDYLKKISRTRHNTARRLGARPTGILERAAASGVSSSADAAAATIEIIPGELFARAFGDVTIRPSEGRVALTIPAHANSYGKTAGEFDNLELVLLGQKKQPALAVRGADGDMIVYFWLVPLVIQKQDRTLLPSDKLYLLAADQGARDFIFAG